MTTSTLRQEHYLYAVVFADAPIPDDLKGIEDNPVATVRHGQLAAVIGELPARPLGKRADLMAHQHVVQQLAERTTVVPARFASVVGESIVKDVLRPHHDTLVANLGKLEGCRQFTLRAEYIPDIVLPEIVRRDDRIRRLREEILRLGEERSYGQRIQQGELVVQAFQQMGRLDAERIHRALDPFVTAVSDQETSRPEEIVRLAVLVADAKRDEFESAVDRIGGEEGGRIQLQLVGPQAPYDFVQEV